MSEESIPRRIDRARWSPEETAIDAALQAVEELGADPRLTDAVTKLDEARGHVADFVDGVEPEPLPRKVTPEQIELLLRQATTEEHVFWGKELVVSYRLPCGFTVTGRGACVDPANFDAAIGRKVAFDDARDQLWQLEGYRLQNALYAAGQL